MHPMSANRALTRLFTVVFVFVVVLFAGETWAITEPGDRKSPVADAGIASVDPTGQRIERLVDYITDVYPVSRQHAEVVVSRAFSRGRQLDLPPELILAVIAVESTFRSRVVSSAGARGLMQVIPKWHPKTIAEIGGAQALFDPIRNIDAGSTILVSYLGAHDGDMRKALLRYNGSLNIPGSRYAERVLKKFRKMRRVAKF